jgi:hypothetical protein
MPYYSTQIGQKIKATLNFYHSFAQIELKQKIGKNRYNYLKINQKIGKNRRHCFVHFKLAPVNLLIFAFKLQQKCNKNHLNEH